MKFPLLVLCLCFLAFEKGENWVSTACEGYSQTLWCEIGSTILVSSANYGRTSTTVCDPYILFPTSQLNTNCVSTTATAKVATQCNRRTQCQLHANNKAFGDTCPGTYKYLQISYFCLQQQTPLYYACEGSTLILECPFRNQSIWIQHANFGRSSRSICDPNVLGIRILGNDLNCRAPSSTAIVSALCNGQQRCEVKTNNGAFGDPCFGTYKYLEVSFTCD